MLPEKIYLQLNPTKETILSEETIDDIIIAVVLFLSLMCRILMILPFQGLRWLVRRYPLQIIALTLGVCLVLIINKAATGGVSPVILTPAFIIVLFTLAGMIAAMWPMKFHELEHVDHKSISPDRDGWLVDL